MRVLSVNVGLPREVTWRGKPVRTGIYKEPVTGRVALRRLNLDGDRQADLRVHGGIDKAVYSYPSEYYELWSRERPELAFGPGTFGENLTTEGLLDEYVSIGDRFRFGTAELVVTQPRLPCFKLGIKMGRDEFVTEFLERGLYGFYLAVSREGDVEAGDPIVALSRDPHRFGVNEVARLYTRDRNDVESMRRAAELDVLPESWRNYFRRRVSSLAASRRPARLQRVRAKGNDRTWTRAPALVFPQRSLARAKEQWLADGEAADFAVLEVGAEVGSVEAEEVDVREDEQH
jgi:MOSC domain-containing protein YiiM